ncbi:MAG: hypothetical protein R3B45_17205 [Bdellovibrionota bacterium]
MNTFSKIGKRQSKMSHVALYLLAIINTLLMACDVNTLQNKPLVEDRRSGMRASDLEEMKNLDENSSNVEGTQTPNSTENNVKFLLKLQGALPPVEAKEGSYELYVISTTAEQYQYVVQLNSEDCNFAKDIPKISISTPINFTTTQEGSYRLCVRAFDSSGNESETFIHPWVVDLKRPSIGLLNVPEGTSGQQSLKITVTSDRARAYRFAYATTEKKCDELELSEEVPLTESIILNISGIGEKRICVKTIDNFDVESVMIDKTWMYSSNIPNLPLLGLPLAYSTSSEIEIIIPQDAEIISYQYNILQMSSDCSIATYSSTQSATTPIAISNFSGSGLNTLCIKATTIDNKQIGPLAYSWIFDQIKKSIILNEVPEVEDPRENLNISISGINLNMYQYALIKDENGKCGNITYSDFQPLSIPINDRLSIGGYTLCVIAKNTSGETSSALRYSWIRIKMPVVSIQAVSGIPPSVTNKVLFENITVAGINAEQYKYAVSANDTDCSDLNYSEPKEISEQFSIDIGNPTSDRTYTLCLQGIGHFSQLSEFTKYNFDFDSTPPAFDILNPPSDPATTNSVSITIQSQNAIEYTYVKKSGNISCNTSPESPNRYPINNLLSEIFSEGQQTLCIWVFDSVGNASKPRTLTWKVDTIAPSIESLSTEDGSGNDVYFSVSLKNQEIDGAYYHYYLQYKNANDILTCEDKTSSLFNHGPINLTLKSKINKPRVDETVRICTYVVDSAGNTSDIKFIDYNNN